MTLPNRSAPSVALLNWDYNTNSNTMETDDDDDMPVLSGSTLAALQNFYSERDKQLEDFEQLRTNKKENISIADFKEDWNQSQFWFTDDTANFLATQLLKGITPGSTVAVVSAPSVYIQLKKILSTPNQPQPRRVCLLEYDDRFERLDGFVRFDFNRLSDLPSELKHSFDRILCDPPYHSKECIIKYAEVTEWLSKEDGRKCMICTGEAMSETVLGAFVEMEETAFKPGHTVRLDNKYACFADFGLS